jgi:hypothetical protein
MKSIRTHDLDPEPHLNNRAPLLQTFKLSANFANTMKAFGTIAVGAFLIQSPQIRASPIEARGWGSVPDAAESLLKYIGISKELLPDVTKLW